MEAEPIREKPAWRRVEDPLTHCLGGESLLLTGYPGMGKTHLARKIVEALRELGDTVHITVQNAGLGTARGGSLGAPQRSQRPLQRRLAGHRRADSDRYSFVG